MPATGPYRIALTTTPTRIDLVDSPRADFAPFTSTAESVEFICHESDWTAGGADMTTAAGATPGRLIRAGQAHAIELRNGDTYFGCTVTGTATLHRTAFVGG